MRSTTRRIKRTLAFASVAMTIAGGLAAPFAELTLPASVRSEAVPGAGALTLRPNLNGTTNGAVLGAIFPYIAAPRIITH